MERIAIDMDEVTVNTLPTLLHRFNKDYGHSVTVEDLKGMKLEALHPELHDEIKAYFYEPSFFRHLQVMDGAPEVIEQLAGQYEVFITTAAMEFPPSFAAKYEWLKHNLSFLGDMNFVFCGDKSIIHADYLIDDNARHFERFAGKGILYTAPHNVYDTAYTRVDHWEDIRRYFLT